MSSNLPAPQPKKVTINGTDFELVAFYYPGFDTAWDSIYQAPFLGNFWVADLTLQPPGHGKGTFHCAEAAFQATKWWDTPPHARSDFENCQDGNAAFHLKKKLQRNGYDHTYAGLTRTGAMKAVIAAKFAEQALAAGLLATGRAYLLEHNSHVNRDDYWSDNCDGTGANHLGFDLMECRKALGGAGVPANAPPVDEFTKQVQGATTCK